MTRMIGYVPVRVGRAVMPVAVEAAGTAKTHLDVTQRSPRIVVAEDLAPEAATREVEAILPEVQLHLARTFLN